MKKGDKVDHPTYGSGVITEINEIGFNVVYLKHEQFYNHPKDYSHVWIWSTILILLVMWVWLIIWAVS